MYRRVAVITHRGSLNGGHFWVLIKKNGEWFKIDDALVKPIELAEVEASQAYMVFYEKQFVTQDVHSSQSNDQES